VLSGWKRKIKEIDVKGMRDFMRKRRKKRYEGE